MTHAGAHLDLSAFSSWEVRKYFKMNDFILILRLLINDSTDCHTGVGFFGSGQIEVCSHGVGTEVWRVSMFVCLLKRGTFNVVMIPILYTIILVRANFAGERQK